MDIRKGDCLLVNLAPFIGSPRRCGQSIPCRVIDVAEEQVQVLTDAPHRQVAIWVSLAWIDDIMEPATDPSPPSSAEGKSGELAERADPQGRTAIFHTKRSTAQPDAELCF